MVSVLAQSASSSANIGEYVQNVFQQAIGIDVMMAFRILALWIFIVWLVFALWVAVDASSRYKRWQVAVLWFLFVLPFNVLGFIGYLFMRPVVTIDEHQWTKLESKYLMHELSSVNDCPHCGTLVPVTNNYCGVCGTQMNINCPKCEVIQSIYSVHCTNCGVRIGEEQKVVAPIKGVYAHESLLHKIKDVISSSKSKAQAKIAQVKETLAAKKQAAAIKKAEKLEKKKSKKEEKKESTEAKAA